ncbi:PREDICTED: leukocyte immunoglobulin-like receptor subfamily B member 5 [Galeopterus variegatus]|uniref:Leukocyte immunoglobulin-like receptor subfamily B member 5 n=1 Tax=Galeopterus variegatus TaxID=482537 RepID=A0ABM0S3V4_GALVR|nr:PREDICTED: leukocyte immunoglobulin-like receptor subfamily B member 5 [Galeopterus variegatus]
MSAGTTGAPRGSEAGVVEGWVVKAEKDISGPTWGRSSWTEVRSTAAPVPHLPVLITGGPENQSLTSTESGTQDGCKWYLKGLIGVSVAFVLLLLLLLFLLIRCLHQGKHRKLADAAEKDTQPEDGVKLDSQHSSQDENHQEVTYTEVNHPRLRQEVASPPHVFSKEFLNMKDRQSEEDRQIDSQAAAAKTLQDVTYAQLHILMPRLQTTPPSSHSGEPPAESRECAVLAIH